jgi:hypothetical protein
MTELIDTRPTIAPEIVDLSERPAAVVEIEGRVEEFPRLLGEAFGVTAQAIGALGPSSPDPRSRGTTGWGSASRQRRGSRSRARSPRRTVFARSCSPADAP